MAIFLIGGLIIGIVLGFVLGCYGVVMWQKKWLTERKVKIGDKIYKLEEVE